jgi:hypothetical protein
VIENRPPLSFVLATELTKAALTRAMRQRRTFTSWNKDVEVRYSVNGCVMGSILDGQATVLDFQIEVKTARGVPGERVRRIQILRNHPTDLDEVEVAAEASFDDPDSNELVWRTTLQDAESRYFLLRIDHENDMTDGQFHEYGSTYAAPVWTRQ